MWFAGDLKNVVISKLVVTTGSTWDMFHYVSNGWKMTKAMFTMNQGMSMPRAPSNSRSTCCSKRRTCLALAVVQRFQNRVVGHFFGKPCFKKVHANNWRLIISISFPVESLYVRYHYDFRKEPVQMASNHLHSISLHWELILYIDVSIPKSSKILGTRGSQELMVFFDVFFFFDKTEAMCFRPLMLGRRHSF